MHKFTDNTPDDTTRVNITKFAIVIAILIFFTVNIFIVSYYARKVIITRSMLNRGIVPQTGAIIHKDIQTIEITSDGKTYKVGMKLSEPVYITNNISIKRVD